ncbi:cytochrome c oxidase assembly protein subunit 20 [Emericellopsis cladophorae]|uniref:Cytochrome c oxidase assembly protein COX20, mitochondrial n=1 Tax=Emericellopsis cladophorae TaxID=2686198 RepID=A0A9P9XYH5_9HYPO|nr:cytochrome c oxidase assembly protein subunit 20 [Emericellopsis cladophorae]KAI6780219.1 cytochrome c oxidase assembly protein subunit 20 [Emericellopsis cladophorae]
MASPVPPNPNSPSTTPNQKTLNVWNKPIDENDAENHAGPVTFTDAVETVKIGELSEVAKYPCVRNALLQGIGAGFGAGGLRFVAGASMASYEWCQYGRRCERREMKRNIEIVTEGRKDQARKKMEQQREEAEARKLQEAQKPWYSRFW